MTNEMLIVMTNFAGRKRLHKDRLMHVARFYGTLCKAGHKLRRKEFDQVFVDLVAKGYGLLDKSKQGNLTTFLPALPLTVIGREMLSQAKVKEVGQPVQARQTHNVIVLFKVKGLRCKAEIPEEVLPEFERIVKDVI